VLCRNTRSVAKSVSSSSPNAGSNSATSDIVSLASRGWASAGLHRFAPQQGSAKGVYRQCCTLTRLLTTCSALRLWVTHQQRGRKVSRTRHDTIDAALHTRFAHLTRAPSKKFKMRRDLAPILTSHKAVASLPSVDSPRGAVRDHGSPHPFG
jgi:hypothetical protein